MYNIKIITVGKIKEQWLELAISNYQKRLSNNVTFNWVLTKNDDHLISICEKEKSYICLDMKGKKLSSENFSKTLFKLFEKQKLKVVFVIGGAEGIPDKIKKESQLSISISDMTFTHQMVRLILLEQIYRAFEIYKGSRYHK